MGRPLLHDVVFSRDINGFAAAQTSKNGAGVDMQADGGADGVLFIALLGALSSSQVTNLKAQQSSDDGGSDAYTDIKDSGSGNMADDDDNQMIILDIFQPEERYVRSVLSLATGNAVIDGVVAIKYRVKSVATSQGATVFAAESLIQPVAGTA